MAGTQLFQLKMLETFEKIAVVWVDMFGQKTFNLISQILFFFWKFSETFPVFCVARIRWCDSGPARLEQRRPGATFTGRRRAHRRKREQGNRSRGKARDVWITRHWIPHTCHSVSCNNFLSDSRVPDEIFQIICNSPFCADENVNVLYRWRRNQVETGGNEMKSTGNAQFSVNHDNGRQAMEHKWKKKILEEKLDFLALQVIGRWWIGRSSGGAECASYRSDRRITTGTVALEHGTNTRGRGIAVSGGDASALWRALSFFFFFFFFFPSLLLLVSHFSWPFPFSRWRLYHRDALAPADADLLQLLRKCALHDGFVASAGHEI